MAIVLSVLCGTAIAADSSPEASGTPQRVTPEKAWFSIEFPGTPTCDPSSEEPDCSYEHPSEGWILRGSYWQVERSCPAVELLLNELMERAREGHFRIEHLETTRVGELPALDYRFESNDGQAYRSVGRLLLLGTQLVHIEVGGDTLPPEETIRHFVESLRVKGALPKLPASRVSRPKPTPVPFAAT